jgi:mannitol/fructose-specific phosphotransferase system IIA component
MGKAPISAFITPAYKKCYEHFLSADKQKAIMDARHAVEQGGTITSGLLAPVLLRTAATSTFVSRISRMSHI